MSRRQGNASRRLGDNGGLLSAPYSKSRSSPVLYLALFVLGAVFFLAYSQSGEGGLIKGAISRVQGDYSCTAEVQRAIPVLKKAYGDGMLKVLHVGPNTCTVVSRLYDEAETEAWGVEPYDVEEADRSCKALVRKGIVRVEEIKYPLPYRPKSFYVVIVSDSLDYLSERYLNKTLPDLARVSADGVVIFAGSPGKRRTKAAEVSKFGRTAKLRNTAWWNKFFGLISLEENEGVSKKFNVAATTMSFVSNCQIFHIRSFN